jgi:hypothetical protein
MQEMTLADWLIAQLKQLDNPAFRAGYADGLIAGQRQAFETTLALVEQSKQPTKDPEGANK